ncbi:Uncharacterized protein CGCS363_v008543 [Colletotrichum siamense]|uniref:Uncharacterized protein n=1 Tax=Colletotrichum siamense TaxID=690259 RepID=UPI0018721F84|nr:Uncharacterized protein CGCS363_v008543 [Colletotrichum siamense]KAF5498012.1 Uncharacterized protein CGCS363_v008543 [Colletotrichum siamense]
MSRVPTIATVVRGASVNIVLKADQPTGRTVSGTVQDVLTRGNHPRGIKVRLSDGRVGRVKSHAGPQQAGTSSANQQQDLSGEAGPAFGDRRGPRGRQGRRQEQDVEVPSAQVGLDAYIRPAKQKKGGRGGAAQAAAAPENEDTAAAAPSEVVACPVCGTFEGDAAVVEHHVASHFD